MENRLKHLEFIQATIVRMASNSFIIKGWAITLVIILFTVISSIDVENSCTIVLFISIAMFWVLDGFFVSRERSFRSLYDHVRKLKTEEIDFSMDISDFTKGKNGWFRSVFSGTLVIFYILLILSMLIIYYLIK